MKNPVKFLIAVIVGILVVVGIDYFSQPYVYQGSLIDPPITTDNFSLPASDGSKFELHEQNGNVVLLFFGYTHCPDVCPTTLYDFKQIKARLGENVDNVRFVFITVDPTRDSLSHLNEYMSEIDEDFIALGGDFRSLEPVWDAFGVYREENDVGSAGGYLVDHTARIYVIDKQGNLQITFPFGMSSEAMSEDLSQLLLVEE